MPLDVTTVTDMPESDRGGTAILLLHGWGARGDDLVPLARELLRPKARFFMPAAPLSQGATGRAWWRLDAADRPEHARDDQTLVGYRPNPAVLSARHSIQKLLRDVRARFAPQRLVLAGFSQGAMLALDVALAADPAVDRVAALSGVLLADSLVGVPAQPGVRPSIFISHGRNDTVVPFRAGELARELLTKRDFAVTFHPFDGGHQIPPDVVSALAQLIFEQT